LRYHRKLLVFFILTGTYAAVLGAEIVGDKLFFTTGLLTTRFRTTSVFWGMTLAFMLKMGVAVVVGRQLSRLPALAVAAMSAASFLSVAYVVFNASESEVEGHDGYSSRQATLVTFSTIFFTEWGDAGQLTAAAMAAHFGVPWVVWLGAVAALTTKGLFAAIVGARVRRWMGRRLPLQFLRYGAVTLFIVLAVVSVLETLSTR